MTLKTLQRTTVIAMMFALMVVMLGAYTRLTDAGLGCPDWPGCYGRMIVPAELHAHGTSIQQPFSGLSFEKRKAWTEMLHRYAAGTLGFIIVCVASGTFLVRHATLKMPRFSALVLVGLVIFQALLGMWTVTLQLLPVVVMAHLLGGILIFAGLCCLRWQLGIAGYNTSTLTSTGHFWVGLGTLILFLQIALGGWVSANYAGIACVGFPTCNGEWLLPLQFSKGFNLFLPVGANYQGGVLDHTLRASIQWIHRIGALVTAAYIAGLCSWILACSRVKAMRLLAILAMMLLGLQCFLGIMNVIYLLPLWVAVAHNGVAAMLFATMVSLFYVSKKRPIHAT